MKTRLSSWLLVFAGAWAIALAFNAFEWRPAGRFRLQTSDPVNAANEVRARVRGWPEPSRLAAVRALERYGLPDTIVDARAVWKNRGPWRAVEVFRDLSPRGGCVRQTVGYAPAHGAWQDLGALDVGVYFDPREGTLTSRAPSEEANILALNVAVDVLEGRRSIADAREFRRRTLVLERSGKSSPYTRGLLFKTTPARPASPWLWQQPVY